VNKEITVLTYTSLDNRAKGAEPDFEQILRLDKVVAMRHERSSLVDLLRCFWILFPE